MNQLTQLQARQLLSAHEDGAACYMTQDKRLGEASLRELIRAGFLSGVHYGLTPKGEALVARLYHSNGKLAIKAV